MAAPDLTPDVVVYRLTQLEEQMRTALSILEDIRFKQAASDPQGDITRLETRVSVLEGEVADLKEAAVSVKSSYRVLAALGGIVIASLTLWIELRHS